MDLIALKKFLVEKCDPDVAHELITWIHSDDAKQLIERELSTYEKEEFTINSERIYHEILVKIKKEESRNEFNGSANQMSHNNSKRPGTWKIISIAASIVLLMTFGFFMLKMNYLQSEAASSYPMEDTYVTKSTNLGQKLTVQLNDGTLVKLNAGSRIRYNSGDNVNRIVELEGEAFFDVVRDESRPFIVKVKNMQVRVLGTSFNVNAEQSENIGVVAVKSGKVEVKNVQSGLIVMLAKDEVGKVTGNENILKSHIESPESVFGWTENKLVFNNSDIKEVLSKITNWFDYEFEVKIDVNALDNFTGSYENPTLKEVLESLSYSYKFRYEIIDKKIVLR